LVLALKKDDDWFIEEPRLVKADRARALELLDAWAKVRIARFIDDGGTDLASSGFDPPARTLTFTREARLTDNGSASGPQQFRVLVSGNRPGEGRLLVKLESEASFYEVPDSPMASVSLDPLFFRDREVLRIASDDIRRIALKKQDAEQALERAGADEPFTAVLPDAGQPDRDHLDKLLGLVVRMEAPALVAEDPKDLSPFGLDEPRAVLTLGLTGDAGIGKAVLVGEKAPGGNVYVMVRGQDVVFMLEEGVAEVLTQDLLKPSPAEEEAVDAETDKPE
jgi:hypothetical protein